MSSPARPTAPARAHLLRAHHVRCMLLLYMPATRTQIYLTAEQRTRLDRIVKRRGVPLAAVVREAVARYLDAAEPDLEAALAMTFGAMPDLEVPSRDEWDRREDGRPADRQ